MKWNLDDKSDGIRIIILSYIYLTLLHSERPKLYAILAFLSAIGLKSVITPIRPAIKRHFIIKRQHDLWRKFNLVLSAETYVMIKIICFINFSIPNI